MTDWKRHQNSLKDLLVAYDQLSDRIARVKMNTHFELYDISPHLAFGGQLQADADRNVLQNVSRLQEKNEFLEELLNKIYKMKEKIRIMIMKGDLYIRYKKLSEDFAEDRQRSETIFNCDFSKPF